ncbi:NUDIX hydrolase [Parapedobacter koreensis]|uniref:8-oxo-dGTP diphosphatase n=1 Tax=Parapedobacter koreensis TaxID=332977 RepID=A0A1H7MBQ6_9SPHI|nr:NUDIX domain-containing protein [Parapedobacter koreensis]SEL08561.1 8-oxo-dGTP diphosphatase [Parapedobacter koreensis]
MQSNLPHLQSIFTTDCVIFGFREGELKVLLIERNEYPFKGWWALPGFFVEHNETIDDAVKRILYEHTGLRGIFMEQLYTFGDLKRHPQGRIITVAYYALLRLDDLKSQPEPVTDYARQAVWHPLNNLPDLAFDHRHIIDKSILKVRRKISYSPIAFELLPEKFTLTQLQQLYEAIWGRKLDKRNFRKKMLNYNILKELPEFQRGVSYRAARLYKLDKRKYAKVFQNELTFSKD